MATQTEARSEASQSKSGVPARRGRWLAQRPFSGPYPGLFGGGVLTSPWDLMQRATDEMDRLLESLSAARTGMSQLAPGNTGGTDVGALAKWAPKIETIEKPNALVVRAELPGLKADDVQVSVEDGLLVLSGERKQEHKEEKEGVVRTERSYGAFYRAVPLPDGVDEDRIDAKFSDGVLEITVPVSARERGRRIQVKS